MMARFEAILPKKTLRTKRLEAELQRALDTAEKDVHADFKKTVATWSKKPKFTTFQKGLRGFDLVLEVGTDNTIYGYVNEGTEPHEIKPKRAKMLRFKSRYRAKTTPGTVRSRQGGASGDDVFSQGVQHPGTEPRDFTGRIEKRQGPKFRRRVRGAIKRGANG